MRQKEAPVPLSIKGNDDSSSNVDGQQQRLTEWPKQQVEWKRHVKAKLELKVKARCCKDVLEDLINVRFLMLVGYHSEEGNIAFRTIVVDCTRHHEATSQGA